MIVNHSAYALSEISITLPVAELQSRIICSEEYLKTLEITVDASDPGHPSGKKQTTYLVQLPELVSSPVINSQLICDVFLQRWITHFRSKKNSETESIKLVLQIPSQKIASHLNSGEIRYNFVSPEPLNSCRALGFCVTSILDLPNINSDLVACTPELGFSRISRGAMPRAMRAEFLPIPKVNIDVFPLRPFSELILDGTASPKSPAYFASTMTIGYGSFRRLQDALGRLGSPTFLLYDAGLSLAAGQEGVATDQSTVMNHASDLYPVPITTGDTFENIHHWKAFVGSNAISSMITGMNISTPANTLYLDLIYSFDDPAIARELEGYMSDAIAQQCSSQRSFSCLSKFVLGERPRQERLEKQLAESCIQFAKSRTDRPTASSIQSGQRYFLQPQTDDIEHLAVELIAAAKSSIVLMSHKLTSVPIVDALEKAKARGLDVFVMSATAPRFNQAKIPDFIYYPNRFPKGIWFPPPHIKALVIDGQRMLFGSGNFTTNGLKESRELFAVTDDQIAASTVVGISNEYRRLLQPRVALPEYHYETSRRLLVIPENEDELNTGAKLRNLSPLVSKFSEAATEPWLTHYRVIRPAANEYLKRCKLDNVQFILAKEFEECLDREVPLSERFASQKYPAQNFMQVAAKLVLPFFNEMKKAEIQFPDRFSLGFHSLRTEWARGYFERRHGIPPMDLPAIAKLLKPLQGARFDLKSAKVREGIRLKDSTRRYTEEKSEDVGVEIATLLQYAFFAAGKGLFLMLPSSSEAMLFLPISSHNLRAYSVHADRQLDDQPYFRYCKALDGIRNPKYFERFLTVALLGFYDGWQDGLSVVERNTLIDGIAIAIAEEFKFLTLDKTNSDHFSGAGGFRLALLSEILNQPEILNTQLKAIIPEGVIGNTCDYFETSYTKRRGQRIKIEEFLTKEIQIKHPKLAQQMLLTGNYTDNLFESLTDGMAVNEIIPPQFVKAWRDGIQFLISDAVEVDNSSRP